MARDVFGFSLGYYAGDYKAIGSSVTAFSLNYTGATTGAVSGKPLYNGNISNATYALSKLGNGAVSAYTYKYDQLNRLTAMDRYAPGTSSWNADHRMDDHAEEVSYDANGNIKMYKRSGDRGTRWDMDQLKYLYYYYDLTGQLRQYDKTLALPGDVKKLTNRLAQVDDAVAANVYTEDIDDQGESNYQYDKIGNLVKDEAEGLESISWTVYGKIASISKQKAGVTTTINYGYDASGNRISKQVQIGSASGVSTFYVRDAQGNVMGVYKQEGTDYQWQEQHLYGSSRLGMLKTELTLGAGLVLSNDGYDALFTGTGGQIGGNWGRAYELSNHLGNVLGTVSDSKIGVPNGSGGISYYIAEVLSQNEYYPFGMGMVGRSYSTGGYRYGFNGKENDNEVKGEGNQQDYGMRIYDTRLGKFLSVDPLSKKYPFYTPYQFASNSPILSVDIDGLESNTNLNPVEGSFTSRYVRSIFKNIVGFDPGRPGPFTTVADPRIGSEDLLLMTMPYRALAEMLGGKKFEETELGQHAKAYGDAVLNGDPDALGNLTADALQLAFAFSGARQQYKQNLAVFDGDAEKFTLEWNKGARQFKISNEASVKNTVKVPKAAAVEGHEGMEFLDDNLRMKEQPFSAHFVDRETVLTSANVTYKGSTTLAHSLSKHSNRHPQRWGTLSGPPSTWHEKAMKHFDDIMNADGPFIETLHDGRYFLEKRLPDGRGIRLNMDKTFKTFIDPKNE